MNAPHGGARTRPAFPWGLTVAALAAFALLVGLGAWQVRRLHWKEGLLARIAALQDAPPRPLLAALAAPDGADFVRVAVSCRPGPAIGPQIYRYAVREGRIGWRLLAPCRLAAGAYDGIMVDLGLVDRLMGATAPTPASRPAPRAVAGVLRPLGARPWLGPAIMDFGPGFVALRVADRASILGVARLDGLYRPIPLLLAAEAATPTVAGVTPAAIPADIPNNHLAYALTWFALALILAWVYAAMVRQRYRP